MALNESAVANPDTCKSMGNYVALAGGQLVHPLDPSCPVSGETRRVHDAFREHVLAPDFACVGAMSAFRRGQYRFALYPEMTSHLATEGLAGDIAMFSKEQESLFGDSFTSFVACFRGPDAGDEVEFEALLWQQLQQLHELDEHAWDPGVSSDPGDEDFSYSFAGHAFFVVGLHGRASRISRRFHWPALVFNPRRQFDRLRARGQYARMQQIIRTRDQAMQGSVNPMLSDFGRRSDARQYSGRAVGDDWSCPFRADGAGE